MGSVLKIRIQLRLDDLGRTATQASRDAGLDPGFIRDILRGKKKSIQADNLEKLAHALECQSGYLTGKQSAPILKRKQAPVTSAEPSFEKFLDELEAFVHTREATWKILEEAVQEKLANPKPSERKRLPEMQKALDDIQKNKTKVKWELAHVEGFKKLAAVYRNAGAAIMTPAEILENSKSLDRLIKQAEESEVTSDVFTLPLIGKIPDLD